MISLVISAVVLFTAALLQATVLARLPADLVRPDVVLVLVWCWALLRGPGRGVLWAAIGGLALDLLSAAPFWSNAFALGLIALAAWPAEELKLQARPLVVLASIVPVTVLYYLVLALVLAIMGWPLELFATLTQVALPASLANALLMPPLYFALSPIARRARPVIQW